MIFGRGVILPRQHAPRSGCSRDRLKVGKSLCGESGLKVQHVGRVQLRLAHDGSLRPLADCAGRRAAANSHVAV